MYKVYKMYLCKKSRIRAFDVLDSGTHIYSQVFGKVLQIGNSCHS